MATTNVTPISDDVSSTPPPRRRRWLRRTVVVLVIVGRALPGVAGHHRPRHPGGPQRSRSRTQGDAGGAPGRRVRPARRRSRRLRTGERALRRCLPGRRRWPRGPRRRDPGPGPEHRRRPRGRRSGHRTRRRRDPAGGRRSTPCPTGSARSPRRTVRSRIDAISSLGDEVVAAEDHARAALRRVRDTPSSLLAGPVADARFEAERQVEQAADAITALRLTLQGLPDFAGANGERTLLLRGREPSRAAWHRRHLGRLLDRDGQRRAVRVLEVRADPAAARPRSRHAAARRTPTTPATTTSTAEPASGGT